MSGLARTLVARAAQTSYKMPPEMLKAREPYRVRNVLVGSGLFGFAAVVYTYSMMAVKQDNFADIDKLRDEAATASTETKSQ